MFKKLVRYWATWKSQSPKSLLRGEQKKPHTYPMAYFGKYSMCLNVFKCGECYLGVSNIHTDKKFALFSPYKPM